MVKHAKSNRFARGLGLTQEAVSPPPPDPAVLQARFSSEARARVQPIIEARRQADPASRRADYKGERARYHLRLPAGLVDDLALLSYLSGQTQNDFCQTALTEAVNRQLAVLREEMDPAEWSVLTRTYHRRRRKRHPA